MLRKILILKQKPMVIFKVGFAKTIWNMLRRKCSIGYIIEWFLPKTIHLLISNSTENLWEPEARSTKTYGADISEQRYWLLLLT
jgi:hypothetical protein